MGNIKWSHLVRLWFSHPEKGESVRKLYEINKLTERIREKGGFQLITRNTRFLALTIRLKQINKLYHDQPSMQIEVLDKYEPTLCVIKDALKLSWGRNISRDTLFCKRIENLLQFVLEDMEKLLIEDRNKIGIDVVNPLEQELFMLKSLKEMGSI